MTVHILKADARALPLQDESVHCCVTSPPYWGLRDYGTADQLGRERTHDEYVANMVTVFREVRRVLRPEGTLWLTLGDSYASKGRGSGLKQKDLVGIPWRVAFALQADGWWLRSDIIWAKPNPMPESVTDRPTRSHEYVFLLAKSARYWYDTSAIAEPSGPFRTAGRNNACDSPRTPHPRKKQDALGKNTYTGFNQRWTDSPTHSRNARSVWTIAPQPYGGPHFATFPEALARRCIRAGCQAGGKVLDPFAGSGTVGKVAIEEGREAVLCDIAYHDLAAERIREVQRPLLVNS
jgi:DNA modification methylase